MAILAIFGPNRDILWAQHGQNGQKIDIFIKVKNVGKNTLKPSPTDLERFRKVLGVKNARNVQKYSDFIVCRFFILPFPKALTELGPLSPRY